MKCLMGVQGIVFLWHRSHSLFLFAGLPHFSVNTLRAIAGLFSSKHFLFLPKKKKTEKTEHGIVHKKKTVMLSMWLTMTQYFSKFLVTQHATLLYIRDQPWAACAIELCTEAVSLYNDTP